MSNCLHCGKVLPYDKRPHARYCDAKCRSYASRVRRKAAEKAKDFTLTMEGYAMLERLREVLPRTAEAAERFVAAFGADCTQGAITLCLTAYNEAVEGKT